MSCTSSCFIRWRSSSGTLSPCSRPVRPSSSRSSCRLSRSSKASIASYSCPVWSSMGSSMSFEDYGVAGVSGTWRSEKGRNKNDEHRDRANRPELYEYLPVEFAVHIVRSYSVNDVEDHQQKGPSNQGT